MKDSTRPPYSRSELKRWVREIPKLLERDYALAWTVEESRAALVMLATVGFGRDSQAVSRFTGVPLPVVEQYNRRLEDNGIWTPDGNARVGWFPLDELGLKLFWADVLVATGKLAKKKREAVLMPPVAALQ